jgi:hypothetical protein
MKTKHESSTVAGAGTERERRPGLRALGDAVSRISAPIAAQRGGTLARLKSNWRAIVGTELADASWPASLNRDGALTLRAAAERALEIQHRVPILIERINLYLGRNAVARIVLVQGPLPTPAQPRSSPAPAIGADEARAIEARLAAVADPELQQALLRLGCSVWAAARRDR